MKQKILLLLFYFFTLSAKAQDCPTPITNQIPKPIFSFSGTFNPTDRKNSRIQVNADGVSLLTSDPLTNNSDPTCGVSYKNNIQLQDVRYGDTRYRQASDQCVKLFLTYLNSTENLWFTIYKKSKYKNFVPPSCSLSFTNPNSASQ